MTPEEIIRMAREAGMDIDDEASGFGAIITAEPLDLERFAALVAAHEREKQAEQEPVAWMDRDGNVCDNPDFGDRFPIPLYAHPVRTKDLTDDEIRFWIGRFPFLLNEKSEKWVIGLARTVIAADREKNK